MDKSKTVIGRKTHVSRTMTLKKGQTGLAGYPTALEIGFSQVTNK
jgi:hypothetical protein